MFRPVFMGAAMAAMMLWMGHGWIMSGRLDLTLSAVLFVMAHVAVITVVVGTSLFVPRVRRVVRAHRPNLSHVVGMLAGAVVGAAVIHGVMHGVVL